MDLDLAQVRAFVAVAELRHFGKAAAGLHITQQALSKRIQRLEQLLGESLFTRHNRAIELTGTGERFLSHAWTLLTVAEAAAADARSVSLPLRVDVWGHLRLPLLWVRRLAVTEPRLTFEVSMRRSLPAAMDALARGQIDVAFGRVHDLGRPVPDDLRHQLIGLDSGGALMSLRHPLARAETVRLADLAATGIWSPLTRGAPGLTGYWERLAKQFHIPLITDGVNLGIEHIAQQLHDHPTRVVVLPADLPIPPGAEARMAPLIEPVPHWPWSIVWRRDDRSPALALLLRQLSELSRAEGWLAFDPARDWLPEPDLADLVQHTERRTPEPSAGHPQSASGPHRSVR